MRNLIVFASLALFLNSCEWMQKLRVEHDDPVDDEAEHIRCEGIKYTVTYLGDHDHDLEDFIRQSSILEMRKCNFPPSINSLYRRAVDDMSNHVEALKSKGYFDGQASFDLVEKDGEAYEVNIHLQPGQRYTIGEVKIVYAKASEQQRRHPHKWYKTGLSSGDEVDLDDIKFASHLLEKHMRSNGYPFAEVMEPEGVVDRQRKILDISIEVVPGTYGKFGKTISARVEGVPDGYMVNRAQWSEGDLYDEYLVERTRRRISESGIFSGVKVKPQKKLDDNGNIPVNITAKKGLQRMLSAGARYASSEGGSLKAMWRHVNLTNNADRLETSAQLGQRESDIGVKYQYPDLLAPNLSLETSALLQRENAKAYTSNIIDLKLGVAYQIIPNLTGSVGGLYEAGNSKPRPRDGSKQRLNMFGIPFKLEYDGRNDFLNPTRGSRGEIELTPFFGKVADESHLTRLRVGGAGYLSLDNLEYYVLAVWGRLGRVFADSLRRTPANRRLYAGGGGSVRGYGYQTIGPIGDENKPTGGLSLLEGGVELRAQTSRNAGFAVFVEGGNVNASRKLKFNRKDTLYAGGVGGRFYASGLVVRVDLAVPFKRRKGPTGKKIDAPLQFIASVGQAF